MSIALDDFVELWLPEPRRPGVVRRAEVTLAIVADRIVFLPKRYQHLLLSKERYKGEWVEDGSLYLSFHAL
jgi:hypothetical protein